MPTALNNGQAVTVDETLADRLERALTDASTTRGQELERVDGNPLALEHQTFNGVQARLVGTDLAYYRYFSGPLGLRGPGATWSRWKPRPAVPANGIWNGWVCGRPTRGSSGPANYVLIRSDAPADNPTYGQLWRWWRRRRSVGESGRNPGSARPGRRSRRRLLALQSLSVLY